MANMSEIEVRGLRSLLLRVGKGQLIIMKTDKSGKFCIVSVEDYIKMGQVHIKQDKELSRSDMIRTDKILNGNSMAWCKIWGTGSAHGHEERIMTSKTSKSENSSDMYLMYKDHKAEPGKTRPVVTGCSSNTRAFSNSVSNLLEAVANSNNTNFESISGEDMLSKKDKNNEEVRKVLEKWERRRESKIGKYCKTCNLEEILEERRKGIKLSDRIGEKGLLPEGWNQQDGGEVLLHPEGTVKHGPCPIGVARTGPEEDGAIILKEKSTEEGLLPEVWNQQDGEEVQQDGDEVLHHTIEGEEILEER